LSPIASLDVIILTALAKDNELRIKASKYKNCLAVVNKVRSNDITEALKEIV